MCPDIREPKYPQLTMLPLNDLKETKIPLAKTDLARFLEKAVLVP
jgi:hypothetical protein